MKSLELEEQLRDYMTGEVIYDPATSRTHYRRKNKKKDNLFFDSLDDDFYILAAISKSFLDGTCR